MIERRMIASSSSGILRDDASLLLLEVRSQLTTEEARDEPVPSIQSIISRKKPDSESSMNSSVEPEEWRPEPTKLRIL